MNLQDTLLSTLTSYGPIVLFVSVLVASIGLPLPVSFLLIAAGAFVEQGALLHKGVAEGTAQVSLNRDKQHKPKACPRLVPI